MLFSWYVYRFVLDQCKTVLLEADGMTRLLYLQTYYNQVFNKRLQHVFFVSAGTAIKQISTFQFQCNLIHCHPKWATHVHSFSNSWFKQIRPMLVWTSNLSMARYCTIAQIPKRNPSYIAAWWIHMRNIQDWHHVMLILDWLMLSQDPLGRTRPGQWCWYWLLHRCQGGKDNDSYWT